MSVISPIAVTGSIESKSTPRRGIKMIVKAVCSIQKKYFGINFAKNTKDSTWEAYSTMKIDESMSKKEGYGHKMIDGIRIRHDYTGCPYCKANSFFLCSCQTLSCSGTVKTVEGKTTAICPNCGPITLSGQIKTLDSLADL